MMLPNLNIYFCLNSKSSCILKYKRYKYERDIQKLEKQIEKVHVKLESKKVLKQHIEKRLSSYEDEN